MTPMPAPAQRDRIERLSKKLDRVVIGSVIVCDLLPILAQLVAALVHGIVTGAWPAHRGLGYGEGFPLWDPLLWLAWGPVLCAAAWIVVSLPVPLRRPGLPGRGQQLLMLLVIYVVTIARVSGFLGAPGIWGGGTEAIFVVILGLGALVLVRIVLGWLRLLPRSWRQYLDAEGNRVQPEKFGTRRSPLAEVPQ